jgi:hypothetical protein
MLETLGIPVLLKAVDFLFNEGSKILAERRARRKSESPRGVVPSTAHAQPVSGATPQATPIQTSEDAIKVPVAENAWIKSEEKVKHLLELLDIYTKNYYLAREAYAQWGSALVPPIVVHNLNEAEDGVASTIKELETILGTVYGREVRIDAGEMS